MPSKVCPRCGSQYASLKSATCPQCFAKLEVVDDEMAQKMAAARALIEATPEFQQAKTEDDERFREQSFGACLGVLGIVLLTLVFAVVLLIAAFNRQHHHRPHRVTPVQSAVTRPGTADILTVLPLADSPLFEVLPAKLEGFRQLESDQDALLPGTLTHIDHARYQMNGPNGAVLEVFAIPTGHPTSEQNAFRMGTSLFAELGTQRPRPIQIFATEQWRYAVVATQNTENSAILDQFREVMAAQFQR